MKRRIFNWLTVLSLLLAVGVAALWVRSVWVEADGIYIGRNWWLVSAVGRIIAIQDPGAPYDDSRRLVHFQPQPIEWMPNFSPKLIVSLPDWILLVILMTPPALWVLRAIKAERRAADTCPACGYDLRGSPGACPECGAARLVDTKAKA